MLAFDISMVGMRPKSHTPALHSTIILMTRMLPGNRCIVMGKWQENRCPRCGGRLFVGNDEDGWYEACINCSCRNELKVAVELNKTAAGKDVHNNAEIAHLDYSVITPI